MTQQNLRVLVVDDSAFMRRAITKMLDAADGIEVVGKAVNGRDAIERVRELRPHVVTLDIEMPEVDGLEALRQIRELNVIPAPAVLMCSSLTTQGSQAALRALRLGAADVIAKDASTYSANMDDMRDELIEKIRAIGRRVLRLGSGDASVVRTTSACGSVPPAQREEHHGRPTTPPRLRAENFDVVVVGSSTGGPPALETLLAGANLRMPIVIAQHMPPMFTKTMADRLSEMCGIRALHGENRMPLFPGTAVVVPGGKHGRILSRPGGKLMLEVGDEPREAPYRPSVNTLFSSAASACGARTLAIVLTGMGDDGRIGAEEIARAGGVVLAQDEATSVVWGMPGAVAMSGTASAVLPIAQLGTVLASMSGGEGTSARVA